MILQMSDRTVDLRECRENETFVAIVVRTDLRSALAGSSSYRPGHCGRKASRGLYQVESDLQNFLWFLIAVVAITTARSESSRTRESSDVTSLQLPLTASLRIASARDALPPLGQAEWSAAFSVDEQLVAFSCGITIDQTESSSGERWIILPTPTYGEWTKPLGLGDCDVDRLVKAEK